MAMTEKDLLRGIGSLDAELVEEAEAYQAPPARHWGRWLAAAACVAIVAGVGWKVLPTLTTETKPPQTTNVTEPETDSTEENTGSVAADDQDTEQWTGETLGGVAIGMTPEEVEAILGSSYEVDAPRQLSEDYWDLCWYYSGLYVRFADQGEGWYVRELMAPGNSTMTLSTGIGVGSSREEILAAYPDASVSESEGIWSAQVKYEDSSLWIFHDAKNGNYINWIARQYMENEKNSTWIATSSQSAEEQGTNHTAGPLVGSWENRAITVLGEGAEPSPDDRVVFNFLEDSTGTQETYFGDNHDVQDFTYTVEDDEIHVQYRDGSQWDWPFTLDGDTLTLTQNHREVSYTRAAP